uniref:TBC1 domain family, member 17 n=1 Tax=Cyprinus carpio TaxID=7962 RepID=A0A8C1M2Q3_CYPCA
MEAKPESHKLIFEKEGVYLHTNAKRSNQDTTIPGFIRIVERGGEPALEWSPVEEDMRNAPAVFYSRKDGEGGEEETKFDPGYEPDWAVISTVKKERRQEHPPVRGTGQWGFSLPLSELYSLRRSRFSLGKNFLVMTTRGGDPLPPLHFHRGGTRELLKAMQRYIRLAPSPMDGRLFLAYPHDSGALSQSFDELHLFDETSADLVSRFIQDPYATTFGGFSKVTNFFRGALRHPESPLGNRSPQDAHFPHSADEEPGFELITCGAELGPRPEVKRGKPLDNWDQFLDPEGRVTDPQKVKKLVFRGGIDPSQRNEVWKFLLGFYPWNSTTKEREDILRVKTDEYFRMKVQWKSVSEEQEMRNSLFRGYRSLIGRFSFLLNNNNTSVLQVLWTRLPCENFHLLMACSILESQKRELIGSNHDFNSILKHINELTMKLDLQSILCGAEAIYLQLTNCKELSLKVQEVLGLRVPSSSSEESPNSEPSETDSLLAQSEARGASSCQPFNGQTPTHP